MGIKLDKRYFPYPLLVKFLDGRMWELLEVFEYHRPNGEVYTVPKGFKFDFASIPRPNWTIIGSPTGKYGPAALVHDHLCCTMPFPFKKIDYIFYEAMAKLKVAYIQRTLMYWAVRIWHIGK